MHQKRQKIDDQSNYITIIHFFCFSFAETCNAGDGGIAGDGITEDVTCLYTLVLALPSTNHSLVITLHVYSHGKDDNAILVMLCFL